MVTGISNALGTWEERMIHDDNLCAEIDEAMAEVFGNAPMSSADHDPLATNSDETSDSEMEDSEVEDPDSDEQ